MKRASLYVSKVFENNQIFTSLDPRLNRDDNLASARHLRAVFEGAGCSLDTHDICPPQQADVIIYSDLQSLSQAPSTPEMQRKSILVINECEVILPHNWTRTTHDRFARILTWHPCLWDGNKFLENRFPIVLKTGAFNREFQRRNLVTLIAGNKRSRHPLELYSKRVEAIRWFEKMHPSDFDLYGVGWDHFATAIPKLGGAIRRLGLGPFLAEKFPSYRGAIDSKFSVLPEFRFAICYENAQQIPGYITEKIFDCFSAGVIPIYWGAPDILDHVPADCFIDVRKYESYEHITHMTAHQHRLHLEAIWSFMHGTGMDPFRYQTVNSNLLKAAQEILEKA